MLDLFPPTKKPRKARSPKAPKEPKAPKPPSKLELRFRDYWRACDGPELIEEYHFHPTRKWRADFAHMESRTLIEIEGGGWVGGRHTSGAGFAKDTEKYLEAALMGWRVLRLTGAQLDVVTIQKIVNLVGGKIPIL